MTVFDVAGMGHRTDTWALQAQAAPVLPALVQDTAAILPAVVTRFAIPSGSVDVGAYATIEDCFAALLRVRQSNVGAERVDTLPSTPALARRAYPAIVIATARTCAQRIHVETDDLDRWGILLDILVTAGSDSQGMAVVDRRLALVPARADSMRVAIVDSAIRVYTRIRPVRLDAVEALAMRVDHVPQSITKRITRWATLMNVAEGSLDTATMRRAARHVVALAPAWSQREAKLLLDLGTPTQIAFAVFAVNESVQLDSLRRHGTAAYVAARRATWTSATGQRPDALPVPVGERAPRVVGDYWFGPGVTAASTDSTIVRPVAGHVTVILFLDSELRAGCLDYTGLRCGGLFAMVRRLAARFPSVDFVFVARTRGYHSVLAPPTPAEEAVLLRDWYLGTFKLPGVLSVTATPFFRVPGLDRRRVENDFGNATHYWFGRPRSVVPTDAFLVDRQGVIIDKLVIGYSASSVEMRWSAAIAAAVAAPEAR